MKRIFKAFTLGATAAGLLFSAATQAQETMRVGDLPALVDTAAGEYQTSAPSHLSAGDYQYYPADAAAYGDPYVQPAGHGMQGEQSYSSPSNGSCNSCYSNSCGGHCDSGYGRRSSRMGSVVNGHNRDSWLRAELLLWFPEARTSPILAATNTNPAGLPAIGQPGFSPQFGGDIDSGMDAGFRADAGKYFADGQFGLGARVWFLQGADSGYSASSDGTTPLGRPFFDTALGIENALLSSYTPANPALTVLSGSIDATSELDIAASELYAKLLFIQGSDYRVDLVGGYSYFNIEDSLAINSSSVRVANPADGLTRQFQDRFETTNNFHGGQIGFENVVNRGRFSIRTLTKVHLGNMNQRVAIDGSSQRFFLGNLDGQGNQIVENFDGGLLAMDNQGTTRRDVFAFAPEANFKLGYRMRNYVNFTVGYSFIYWNNVALAGEQIDRNVNSTGLLNNAITVASPSRSFTDRGFFVQGLDLGLSIDY